MTRKRFRAGSFVHWPYKGQRVYGIVLGLLRTNYSVLSLTGAGSSNGRRWSVGMAWLTYVPPSKVPEDVTTALAAYTLTGKVPK